MYTICNLFTKYKKTFLSVLCFAFAISTVKAQFYYGMQTEFGKSRIKYEDFFWTSYAYENYDVYFYEEGKELANYVSKTAANQITAVEKFFDYQLDDRLQFIVFNKHSDFKQSNIGFASDEQNNVGGVTRIVGTKIILYYEGDHAKLDAQIRAGIAQVIIDEMMYGGNIRQMVKNSSTLNLPDWYLKGLISFIANDWNSTLDNRVRDGMLSGKYEKINYLQGNDAVYAGNAFWKHISNNYGETVIPNILYMTKVSHNVNNATTYVLGLSVQNLWNECMQTFIDRYNEKDTTKSLPDQAPILKKPKSSRVYSQVKISPDGKSIVYTTNEMGQYKVWLYDVSSGKSKRIYKAEHKMDRINDYSFPLVAWHPSSKLFSFIIERKSYLVMKTYEPATKSFSERNITGFEKILDYSYNEDGKKIVMSAVQKGQTDIFIFTAASSAYYQITKDIYDDLTPRFVNNSKGVVFTSNRPNDSLFFDPKRKYPDAQTNMDVFFFNNITKSPALIRVTNTASVNEKYPADYDSTHICYLSDLNGIHNRFVASFDSVIAFVDTSTHYRTVVSSFPITNYSQSILEQDVNTKANMLTEVVFVNGKYRMFSAPLTSAAKLTPTDLINTSYRDYKNNIDKQQQQQQTPTQNQIKKEALSIEINKQAANKENKETNNPNDIDINNYTFEGEQKKPKEEEKHPEQKVIENETTLTKSGFQLARQQNYYTHFSVDYVVSQLDNSFLNNSYQKFTGGGRPVYLNPGLNAFFKVSISDLFEDYRMMGGMRVSADLSNNEFFASYEDRMKNLDKQIILHRQKLITADGNNTKIFTHDARYVLKLPLSEVSCLRGSVSYRNNRLVYTAIDDQNLAKKDSFENWGSTLLEYVFDNTIKRGLNAYNGFRGKIFGEYYRRIDKSQSNFFVVGCDARYYQKIHRNFIWANRFAASTSFGNEKLIYYMGGVDNWFLPKFDNTTDISTTQNYAFQTLATNMRGFYQNARNGNSFAVINSELRFPIFSYLIQRPISSDFIENFQIIGFTDIGTAWVGKSPFSDSRSTGTKTIYQPPLVISLYSQHNPLIAGYGWGVRTRIWGYFIRVDRAWGMQDGIVLKPIWHLSLGFDF